MMRTLEMPLVLVGSIARPLTEALTFGVNEDAAQASQRLKGEFFDAAPVLDSAGDPIGVFEVSTAAHGTVGELMQPLASKLILSAEASISVAIERLQDVPLLFVLGTHGINGFLTLADCGRPEGRTHFYLLLSRLESLLHEAVSQSYPNQSEALAHLSPKRRQKHAELIQQLHSRDTFIDDLSSLSIRDLYDIWVHTGHNKRYLGSTSYRKAFGSLNDFRNDIMHSSRALHWSGAELLKNEHRLKQLIEAVGRSLEAGDG